MQTKRTVTGAHARAAGVDAHHAATGGVAPRP